MSRSLAMLAALAMLALTAFAQPRLSVGDPAPALQIGTWVKGEPVTEFHEGHVYVVEFWATWCPPCRKSIPHLTELQKKHKDAVTIVGISAQDMRGETLDKVRSFVAENAETMDYTVAFDDGSKTNEAYMVAARQRGIPTAFVVDQRGRLAWIGHPLMGLDDVLDQVLAGTFNPAAASKGQQLASEIGEEIRAGRHEEALAKIDSLVEIDPAKYGQYAAYKFGYLLSKKEDRPGAYAYGRAVVASTIKDNPGALHAIAWTILADKAKETRDLDFALETAKRAAELSASKDAPILETLALAYHEKGLREEAIETQAKAVAVAQPAERPAAQAKLAEYKAAR